MNKDKRPPGVTTETLLYFFAEAAALRRQGSIEEAAQIDRDMDIADAIGKKYGIATHSDLVPLRKRERAIYEALKKKFG